MPLFPISDDERLDPDTAMRASDDGLPPASVIREQLMSFSDIAVQFTALCDAMGQSRELSLAKTRMQEALMWATAHCEK